MEPDITIRSRRVGRRQLLATAAAFVALGTGIRADAHDKTPAPSETPASSAAGTVEASPVGSPVASPVVSGPVFEASMQSLKFIPQEIDITVGTTVIWTNEDVVAHTVTHRVKVEDQLFASPLLAPGDSFSYTFDKAGTYPFYCLPHPFMTGSVVVSD